MLAVVLTIAIPAAAALLAILKLIQAIDKVRGKK